MVAVHDVVDDVRIGAHISIRRRHLQPSVKNVI
jgi:hypothetical protein